jgi:hypothetical protein
LVEITASTSVATNSSRTEPGGRALTVPDAEEIADQPEVRLEGRTEFGEVRGDLLHRQVGLVVQRDVEIGRAQELQHRLQRRCGAIGLRAGLEHRDETRAAPFREFVAEPALAGPGRADDAGDARAAGLDRGQGPLQQGHLALAAAERRQGDAAELLARDRRLEVLQQIKLDRLGHAAQAMTAERADVAERTHQTVGLVGQADLVRLHLGGQAACEMNGETVGAVLGDGVDDRSIRDDLAGMQPDAHRHGVIARAKVVPDGERRFARQQGVTFLRARRAEEGEDAVAERTYHRALEPRHGVAHGIERGLEALHGIFGREPGDDLGRADEIGKQHRHLLQFAAERPRGRARRCRERPAGCVQGAAAGAAKARAGRAEMIAGRTGHRQRRAAAMTEAIRRRIVPVAPLTKHLIP